jgi:hypothetical protein
MQHFEIHVTVHGVEKSTLHICLDLLHRMIIILGGEIVIQIQTVNTPTRAHTPTHARA